MAQKPISAKDKAFEKERMRFRHEIRDRDHQIADLKRQLQKEHTKFQDQINTLQTQIITQQEWIERLCDYINQDINTEPLKSEDVIKVAQNGQTTTTPIDELEKTIDCIHKLVADVLPFNRF